MKPWRLQTFCQYVEAVSMGICGAVQSLSSSFWSSFEVCMAPAATLIFLCLGAYFKISCPGVASDLETSATGGSHAAYLAWQPGKKTQKRSRIYKIMILAALKTPEAPAVALRSHAHQPTMPSMQQFTCSGMLFS